MAHKSDETIVFGNIDVNIDSPGVTKVKCLTPVSLRRGERVNYKYQNDQKIYFSDLISINTQRTPGNVLLHV